MALNQLLHRKSQLTRRRRASSIRMMRNVEVPRYECQRSSKTVVYITSIDNGSDYWEIPIRYSRYHEFWSALCKTDKKWVSKLPFPEKSFGFGKDSPDYRRRQLDLFMRQLNALFTSLSAEGQDLVLDFLEAKHHLYHYERESSLYDHYDDEKASRRGFKSSTHSETDCEDNQSEPRIDSPSFPDRSSSLHHTRSSSLHSSHCSSVHEEMKLPLQATPRVTPSAAPCKEVPLTPSPSAAPSKEVLLTPSPSAAPSKEVLLSPSPTAMMAPQHVAPPVEINAVQPTTSKLQSLVSQVELYAAPDHDSTLPLWQQESTLSTYTRPAHLNPVVVKTWARYGEPTADMAGVESNILFDGRNFTVQTRMTLGRCQRLCKKLQGRCKAYVWRKMGGGTCMIKDVVGAKRLVDGAVSKRTKIPEHVDPLPVAQTTTTWGLPLPTYTFSYTSNASWLDEKNLRTKGYPLHSFGHVYSIGECATLATTVFQTLFTYNPTKLECYVYAYARKATEPGVYMRKSNGIMFDALPEAFQTAEVVNGTSLTDCATACEKSICVAYRLDGSSCKLYAPSIHGNDYFAGWIHQPLIRRDVNHFQYLNLRGYALDGLNVTSTIPSISTLDACALAANSTGNILFAFNAVAQTCSMLNIGKSMNTTTYLMNNPTSSVPLLNAAFTNGSVDRILVEKVDNASSCALPPLCQVTSNECFATTFNSSSNECELYKAKRSFEGNLEIGWLAKTSLPTKLNTTEKVAFFVTAHQDDHELFMIQSVLNSIGEANTKVIFVYITAGDLFSLLKWEKRERSTIVGTQVALEYHGLYQTNAVYENVDIGKHTITKVTMGNAIHYMMRLPEAGSTRMMNPGNRKSSLWMTSMDKPNERYNSYNDVKMVVENILELEAEGISHIEFHTSEFLRMNMVYNSTVQEDHFLHRATGELTASIIESHPKWQSCAHQQYYFGYQKWMWTPDLPPTVAQFQRYLWLREFAGIMDPRNSSNGWDFHAKQLGRMYKSRIITPSVTSCL
ncbi:hypothetical protein THRCLA_04861 [Thraustotheca clavata]|uniref:Apple domain-containing protein n=1 Tax=Thraustotheca clavata TaxID=74557 RepID=A0A1V9ZXR1_9STRA|nr:hypothetical protein THRCLA_04861 [Thraustotheca clavata]